MQKLLGQVRRCVEDYRMIDAGDTVAVGVSGGKDSLVTLIALARLRAFYPIPFTVHAITLETGTPGMCFDAVADLCRQLDVPYTRIQVPVYDIVFNERKEKNPCSLCANGHSRRQEVKELIAGLEGRYPDIKQKLFGSLQRYPLYGWNLHEEER